MTFVMLLLGLDIRSHVVMRLLIGFCFSITSLLLAGTGVALAGVFAYSQVKRLQTSKPKAV